MVWVVPGIIWLAVGADRPRRGLWLAGVTAVLFISAPIWWVPTSWKVTTHPPELHQDYWQLFAGNSFFFAMLAFLAGVTVMLVRRSRVALREVASPALLVTELREHRQVGRRLGRAQLDPPVVIGATDVDRSTADLELVGSERSAGPD
jgi:hypothetical protein